MRLRYHYIFPLVRYREPVTYALLTFLPESQPATHRRAQCWAAFSALRLQAPAQSCTLHSYVIVIALPIEKPSF